MFLCPKIFLGVMDYLEFLAYLCGGEILLILNYQTTIDLEGDVTNRILLLALFLFYNITNAQWIQQVSGVTNDLAGVYFFDENNGIIVGDEGTILKTSDGGANWIQQTSGTIYNLKDVTFLNTNDGWAVGNEGTILRTTDGGTSWAAQSSGITNILTAVSFTDINFGMVAGYDGLILQTSNGGTNWVQLSSGTIETLEDVYLIDVNNGFTVGWNGTILTTTNSGIDWLTQSSGSQGRLMGVSFINSNEGVVVGNLYTSIGYECVILKTTDAGTTWTSQINGIKGRLEGISFISPNIITVVGAGNTEALVLRTTDGGISWARQTSGVPEDLQDVFFLDENIGTAVGEQSEIIRTTNGGGYYASTILTADAFAGGQILEVVSTNGFSVNDNIIINPGGSTEESNKVIGFGSLQLETPLIYDHQIGEVVLNMIPSDVDDAEQNNPTEHLLYDNYPNPFNPATNIKYTIPHYTNVVIKIFDVLGNEIKELVDEEKASGTYDLIWNADGLTSGIYFYQIRAGDFLETKKMILIK